MVSEHLDQLNELNRRIASVLLDLEVVRTEPVLLHDGTTKQCWRYHRACLAARIKAKLEGRAIHG